MKDEKRLCREKREGTKVWDRELQKNVKVKDR